MGLKRFLLFTFSDYYPRGGWDDFAGSFETEAEATTEGRARVNQPSMDRDAWQVVDLEIGSVVSSGRGLGDDGLRSDPLLDEEDDEEDPIFDDEVDDD